VLDDLRRPERDGLPDLRDRFYEVGDVSYKVASEFTRRLAKDRPSMASIPTRSRLCA
jgi:hypothetical protein